MIKLKMELTGEEADALKGAVNYCYRHSMSAKEKENLGRINSELEKLATKAGK